MHSSNRSITKSASRNSRTSSSDSKYSRLGITSSTKFPPRPYQNRKKRHESSEELNIDFNQDGHKLLLEILTHVSVEDSSKGKRLAYLNVFVSFLELKRSSDMSFYDQFRVSVLDVCLCLRCPLVSESTVIRIATLRVLRYLLCTKEDVLELKESGIICLVVRSLDIVLNNTGERIQAVRLCQKILATKDAAKEFPEPLTRALIAMAFDGVNDKLHRSAIAILCELALLHPAQFIHSGGVRILLHNALVCNSPMVLEAIIGSLLHLLNVPETRHLAKVNLDCLIAPLTDLHYKHNAQQLSQPSGHTNESNEREQVYQCARTGIGIVIRSWSGMTHFCQAKNSGLEALINALYIEQIEIRRTIIDMLCDILGIKYPNWSDEVIVALSAVDASHPKENWKLQEGFLVEEAASVIPHLAATTPSITKNHMALVIYTLAKKGLLEALVEVIVSSDTFISLRATVLLGEVLSLLDKFVPLDCFDPSQCVPSLIRYCMGVDDLNSSGSPESNVQSSNEVGVSVPMSVKGYHSSNNFRQQKAMEAVSVLSSLHRIKGKAPLPNSLFLEAQLLYSGSAQSQISQFKFIDRLGQAQITRLLGKDVNSKPLQLLRETGVLVSKDSHTWRWDIIATLIKWSPKPLVRIEDSSWKTFFTRTINYFKPSSNLFARVDLAKDHAKLISRVGCLLIELLAEKVENFIGKTLLEELLSDIVSHLDEILSSPQDAFSCFLSPNKMENSAAQSFFLFIGKLTNYPNACNNLVTWGVLQRFLDLVSLESVHLSYIKLILGSLSYKEEKCRAILDIALDSKCDEVKIYATGFLRVLLRCKAPGFSKWGVAMLIRKLKDESNVVSLTALSILEESIHDKMLLESCISHRPELSSLGYRGYLLQVTFLSLPSGYRYAFEENTLSQEVQKWVDVYNKRYVEIIEILVRDCASTLRRDSDGKYPKRTSRDQVQSNFRDIYVPPHLYGQLSRHKEGMNLLMEHGNIDALVETVLMQNCKTEAQTLNLKAALWAVSHFATSTEALQYLAEKPLIPTMVQLGSSCPILSIRYTLFHCVALISSTQAGAEALRKYNWHAMPRNHHQLFPLWTFEHENDDLLGEERNRYVLDDDTISVLSEFSRQECQGDDFVDFSVDRGVVGSVEEYLDSKMSSDLVDSNSVIEKQVSTSNGILNHSRRRSVSISSSVISSEDSSHIASVRRATLSPIPSSASIATTIHSPSGAYDDLGNIPLETSRLTLTDPGGVVHSPHFCQRNSPRQFNFYRSLKIRKHQSPGSLQFWSSSVSHNQKYPEDSFHLLETKGGSLDRHLIMAGSDMCSECSVSLSKILRVNSSLTSLSTPSFRAKGDAKGPVFMGLALPKDFSMIFQLDESASLASTREESNLTLERREEDIFEFHSVRSCLGCYKLQKDDGGATGANNVIGDLPASFPQHIMCNGTELDIPSNRDTIMTSRGSSLLSRDGENSIADTCELERRKIAPDSPQGQFLLRREIIRFVSNMISCVGSRSNEQGLLRLKQKFPQAFQDLCLYSELCSLMENYNIRLHIRRFIQELFLDVPFQEFCTVASQVLDCLGAGDAKAESKEEETIPKNVSEKAEVSEKNLASWLRNTPIIMEEELA